MLIVDTALEAREKSGNPIRVAQFGAGYVGTALVRQIERHVPGMTVSVLYNRTLSRAIAAFESIDITPVEAESLSHANEMIAKGRAVVTDDPEIAVRVDQTDAILEVTGHVEFSAKVALDAIEHHKHIVLQNAELDSTVGSILKHKANAAGVLITQSDGDQPGVTMNLFRWVKSLGLRPVLAGSHKGILDHYRTPETQAAFAAQYGLTPEMATSAADGTKLAMEMALIGNATGFGPMVRGMRGPKATFTKEAVNLFDCDELLAHGGCIDYLLGAEPGPGVFVLGYEEDPVRRAYMPYYKMGNGPLYCFYIPYHLPHLETPLSIARLVDFADLACTPKDGPVVDVVSIAKRDLKPGDKLDGIGGFTCYGVAEKYSVSMDEALLPIGLAVECELINAVPKDQPIRMTDIAGLPDSVAAKLRTEQDALYPG